MRIIVPRLADEFNTNAQILNARSLLSRFCRSDCEWHCSSYGRPDPAVVANRAVKVTQLAPWRAWPWHMMLLYQQSADAIFYPGVEWFDPIGLKLRDLTRRRIPVIATLEGLVGDQEREEKASRLAGHPVHCQRVSPEGLERFDYVMHRADHIIAISPFLVKMARELYGDKCSALPLGIDVRMFSPAARSKSGGKVLSVGNVRAHKRPELFLSLARRFPDSHFRWIGEGDQRNALIAEAARRRLPNLDFAGPFSRAALAEELRAADVFVMPSRAEGVPKAVQEAVACGVPCIVYGTYETPSVVDGQNGWVVWSD
ncbi:MAG: glycosyltransferase family 4 protein, partial [Alphaproteobacteria bacterium]|nr:glycosyltransferase family 4 protein [Alphaproteobacteria bacterium]